MKKTKTYMALVGVLILSFYYGSLSGIIDSRTGSVSAQTTQKTTQTTSKSVQTKTQSDQTKPKSAQTTSKSTQTKSKSTQAKPTSTKTGTGTKSASTTKAKEPGTITIGIQIWAVANLNVSTFRNGDTIPEARTNSEWVAAGEAGKPAWCYYNNDPKNGAKYGKLYNWYAVNDPRGLTPVGWRVPGDADWAKLVFDLGGQVLAGAKLKSLTGWIDGSNGTNESGFNGLPGGYRIENGIFRDIGSIGTWWSSTESRVLSAYDFYLVLGSGTNRSSSPKQRGASVRCLKD
jgi:uncharacterized protein (TIGR02145 family)